MYRKLIISLIALLVGLNYCRCGFTHTRLKRSKSPFRIFKEILCSFKTVSGSKTAQAVKLKTHGRKFLFHLILFIPRVFLNGLYSSNFWSSFRFDHYSKCWKS